MGATAVSVVSTLSCEERAFWQSKFLTMQRTQTPSDVQQPVDVAGLCFLLLQTGARMLWRLKCLVSEAEINFNRRKEQSKTCSHIFTSSAVSLNNTKLNKSQCGMISECSKFTHILYSIRSAVSLLSLILFCSADTLDWMSLYQSDHLYTPGTSSTTV